MIRSVHAVRWAVVAGLVVVAGTLATLGRGPLDPPAGPVGPTYKTLAEVEPRIAVNATNTPGDATNTFRITQPGSYYLTGNITGEAGKNGIRIDASGVSLDLMGHDLIGALGSLNGITTPGFVVELAVLNGSVQGWQTGMDMAAALDVHLDGLRIQMNILHGIVTGDMAMVTDCSLRQNGGQGINVGAGSTVRTCTARANGAAGITIGANSTITGCASQSNSGTGISASFGSVISSCAARLNTGSGFIVSSGSTIADCSAQSNTLDGINVTGESFIRNNVCDSNGVGAGSGAGIHVTFGDNRIEGNSCTRNDRGLDIAAAGNIVMRNTCSGNTVANWVIVVGNAVAPIVQATITATAINGSTYPGNLGSTDPNANFTY